MNAPAQIDIDSLIEMELPPLPMVALRVAKLTEDLNASARSVADAVGCDPVLTARVLRIANSPLYYSSRTVTALPAAVNTLGNESLHSLVFVSLAADAFRGKSHRSTLEVTLWEHSVAVGIAARRIMLLLGMRGMEEGFLCGLLHDFGKLLLMRYGLLGYQGLLKVTAEADLLAAEQALFGYTHPQVGALAAKRWDLPEAITDAIYHHHEPSKANESTLMAHVVAVADALANRAGLGLWGESDRDIMQTESVVSLRLTQDQLNLVWADAQASITETCSVFN